MGLPGADAANSTTRASSIHRATVEQAALRAQAHSTRRRVPRIGAGSKGVECRRLCRRSYDAALVAWRCVDRCDVQCRTIWRTTMTGRFPERGGLVNQEQPGRLADADAGVRGAESCPPRSAHLALVVSSALCAQAASHQAHADVATPTPVDHAE